VVTPVPDPDFPGRILYTATNARSITMTIA
jgi:hypothetical protein